VSTLVGGIAGAFVTSLGVSTSRNDDRLQPPDYKMTGGDFVSSMPMTDADILWPRSRMQGAASSMSAPSAQGVGLSGPTLGSPLNCGTLNSDPAAQAWEWNVYTTGSRHRMVFTGKTLNSSGAALGGCTVQLFNTATGLLVDTQTSDSSGNYKVTDPNNVACFMIAYLPGSPDVAGTTIDELTGT
jgi:hypothetical protein